jgi:hypothetical protein
VKVTQASVQHEENVAKIAVSRACILQGMACLSRVREVPARHGEHRDPPSQPGSEGRPKRLMNRGIDRIQGLTPKEGPEDGCADSVSARIRRFANHVPLTKATGHEHAKKIDGAVRDESQK